MPQIVLPEKAVKKLLAQDPKNEHKGGFQKLVISLQRQLDSGTGILNLSESQLEKMERYRKQYGRGGWQDILDAILKQGKKH